MRSGIYALVNLAGAPVCAGDAAVLGLAATQGSIAVRAVDGQQRDAISIDSGADRVTVLLGFLDEPKAAAAQLSLPNGWTPAALARAALDRDGAEAARLLLGEWSLLDWNRGTVVLMSARARRDPILFARRGAVLAVAPSLDCLARLSWVGRTIDPLGLGFAAGRRVLRAVSDGRTIVDGVRTVKAGTTVLLDRHGEKTIRIAPFPPVVPFDGSFEEAIELADTLFQRIVGDTLTRTPAAACLLSGGLDSSLIAMVAAQRRAPGQPLVCLGSAAPAASGLADEMPFAAIVADHLGLPLEGVAPPDLPTIYRPSEAEMGASDMLPLSVRHYLYDALWMRAERSGLPLVFDGGGGEMTITGGLPIETPGERLRRFARTILRRTPGAGIVTDPICHVRLAPHRRAAFLTATADMRVAPISVPPIPTGRWGYGPGVTGLFEAATELRPGRLRAAYPFRDPRLIELFAGFPAGFMHAGGLDRAPARHMMIGHLPDTIRLRPKGTAFSPDYFLRLQAQAPGALARLPVFRAADIDDWLDLAWLEKSLQEVAARGGAARVDLFETQLTAIAAEYLLWWQSRG